MSGWSYIARPAHGAAWVTGASAGIGRATARRLAADGWRVYVTARSEDKLKTLAEETDGACIPMQGDVTDAARMAGIVAEIEAVGPLALAIFNAGVYTPLPASEFDPAVFAKHVDVNLTGVANGLGPAMAAMLSRGSGHLAVVASVAGYRGLPKAAAYGATKAGLINMAEALAFELLPKGVRISVVNPGFVETGATAVNDFKMPFLMQTGEAADRLVDGLARPGFEIAFPRRFSLILKTLGLLPARAYLAVAGKAMGY